MEDVILFIIFVAEVVKYYLAYKVFFKESLRRYLVPAMGVGIYLAALFLFRDTDKLLLAMLIYLFVLCIIFIVQKTTLLERIRRLIILIFCLCCTDAFFEKILDIFMKQNAKVIGWDSLIESLLTLFVIAALYVVQKNNRAKSGWWQSKLEQIIMPIVVLMSIEILLTISLLDYIDIYIDNLKAKAAATILCLLAYLSIGILSTFIIYIRQVNRKLKKLVENELLLQDMQRHYYESLLEGEEDTRRYRHDIANHLLCINRLVEENDLTALQEYLGDMRQELQVIQKNEYDSGNRIINVITNHYTKQLTSMTEIKITGRIQIQLDEMKLCTIYANLLQNAVEEIKRCEGANRLQIQFEQGLQFCRISICNSLSEDSRKKTEKQFLKSDKPDQKNHGMGLLNVKKAVDVLNGTLELSREDNCFFAVVVLPLQ